MVVVDLVRSKDFVTWLTPHSPFVFCGLTGYYKLKESWGSSCDDLFNITTKQKVLQSTQNYMSRLIKKTSLALCVSTQNSFYFDRDNQIVYVHVSHTDSPNSVPIDYGYSFGLTDKEVLYIDDYEYLPLIKTSPSIDRESDYINSSKPTGSTGTLVIDNPEYENLFGVKEGRLDFLLTENIYGNDILVYNYDGALNPISCKYAENIDVGENEISIDLQDRRFE